MHARAWRVGWLSNTHGRNNRECGKLWSIANPNFTFSTLGLGMQVNAHIVIEIIMTMGDVFESSMVSLNSSPFYKKVNVIRCFTLHQIKMEPPRVSPSLRTGFWGRPSELGNNLGLAR